MFDVNFLPEGVNTDKSWVPGTSVGGDGLEECSFWDHEEVMEKAYERKKEKNLNRGSFSGFDLS